MSIRVWGGKFCEKGVGDLLGGHVFIWSNGDRVNLFKEVSDNSSGVDDPKFIWWKIVHKLCVH